VLLPAYLRSVAGFPETRATVAALRQALEDARPPRVVCISTIGAQTKQENLLTPVEHHGAIAGDLPIPTPSFGRRGSWRTAVGRHPRARDKGRNLKFPPPLDKPVPMVAATDVGRVAAELLPGKLGRRQS